MAVRHIVLSITGLAISSLCLAQMPGGGPSVVISRNPYANTTTNALGLEFLASECQNVPPAYLGQIRSFQPFGATYCEMFE
jgi:hypothetical protein